MNETISTNLSVAGVGSKTICNGAHNQSYQRQGAVLIAIRVTHPLIKNNSVIVVAGLHPPSRQPHYRREKTQRAQMAHSITRYYVYFPRGRGERAGNRGRVIDMCCRRLKTVLFGSFIH